MGHLPHLVTDLAVILAAAAVSTLLFSRLKQPIVLGYLIAGFAVGPFFPFWPNVVDHEGVKLWAEIGVIFLLFGLGLEFSFKKLAKVGKSAGIAAIFEILTMGGLGYLFGRAFGWSVMDGVFLGAILSMSSTTIIIRAFGEAGLRGKGFVNLVFGILIVEDLMAILLMVLLTAISVPDGVSWSNLAFLAARLVFFLVIWFVAGIYFLPTLLARVRRFLSAEIMLIVSVGLCLLMVVAAASAGFSAAIGAFIMGSILAETREGERIEHLIEPLKNLFGAVFFVSVGMMIDPAMLREHFWVVLLITILTIVGKLFGSGFGAVLSGRSLRQSVQAGMSLAQIGEFSFIIATLGVTLKLTSDFLYPIVVAVSAVTTFTTPYLIRHSDPIYLWIERNLPRGLLDRLERYEQAMNRTDSRERPVELLWRVYGLSALLNSVVIGAIGLASGRLLLPYLLGAVGDSAALRLSLGLGTVVACAPFLYALTVRSPRKVSGEDAATLERIGSLQLGVWIARILLAFVLVEFIIGQFATSPVVPLAVLAATPVVLIAFRGLIARIYAGVEGRFLTNLNARELAEAEAADRLPRLAPWNASLSRVTIAADSRIAGRSLEEARFRTSTGATVAMIDRGSRRIFAPKRSERLLPQDQVYLVGNEEQLSAAQAFLDDREPERELAHDDEYDLQPLPVKEGSEIAKRSIRDAGVVEKHGALIVGVERRGERILNPESSFILEPEDVLWVFGPRSGIRALAR
jgi:CPA2 family monovalent cation:H+ antiporter-2